jgi:DNA recombination protein RmuC
MDNVLIILLILLVLLIAGGFTALFFALKAMKKDRSQDEQVLKLQGQIDALSNTFSCRIQETNQSIQKQFSESVRIVRDVTEKLVKLDETNRQIVDYTAQLRKLEDVLRSPKQRGLLGEYQLESMLGNVFAPGQYAMQYRFPDGNTVDAVIFVKNRIIPVDAKFSLERYEKLFQEQDAEKAKLLERDLRNDFKARVTETKKYIMPQHGTTDFALMFIPAEGVYYHFLAMKVGATEAGSVSLLEFAFSQRVIITSPVTLFAYLQTIVQGLHALQIEESVRHVIDRVRDLGRHMGKFDENMQKLGTSLGRAVGSYEEACRELGKIDKDILRISDSEKAAESAILKKPENG